MLGMEFFDFLNNLVHPTYSSTWWHHWLFFLSWSIDDEGLSREEHASDRDRILESGAGDLGWVDDTSPHEILVLVTSRIISIVWVWIFDHF